MFQKKKKEKEKDIRISKLKIECQPTERIFKYSGPALQITSCAIYKYFHKLSHSSYIFPTRGENVMITKILLLIIILFQLVFPITVVSFVSFFKYFDFYFISVYEIVFHQSFSS